MIEHQESLQEFSAALPIADFRQRILDEVDAHQVTIITAETGAGKSTQVPQYLAEHGYKKVIVTQPRILAARSLSMRVREEWGERHDGEQSLVGYRTAHERDDAEWTVILYCTDGLQLVRELTGDVSQDGQVLILDEIHEWNQNMEVLVAWAKKRCAEDEHFKVVVMSATIDAQRLADYFGSGSPIAVPGRSHPITMREGGDLVDELEMLVAAKESRNALVFLPGKSEIERVTAQIAGAAWEQQVPIIPLHSQLEAEQQQLAFEWHPQGKVILATNIAQTSVTISDVDLVLDSGLERRVEIHNGVEGLFIAEVSRADCLQRAGRAGRTKPGDYILASLEGMPCSPVAKRDAYAIPEILRTHLDRLVLRLASVGIDIETLEFFHTPGPEAIAHAKQTLQNLGAMTPEGLVTELGHKMEKFPVESRYARMLVEAEKLPGETQIKLAAIIAIQEVGGIVRGGSRSLGWRHYTSQTQSDLLAQYDVFLAVPGINPDELEDLGIVSKSFLKASETFDHLKRDLWLTELELSPIQSHEAHDLMRCIVAGQIDSVWMVARDGYVTHIGGGEKRELSGGTVIVRDGLITGTPFNLEVPTPRGLETLALFQDVTSVDPRWLQSLAPHIYKAQPGKKFFDSGRGCLAQHWLLTTGGKIIKGASTPIEDVTAQNVSVFVQVLSEWLYAKLEEDRRRLQKVSGKRLHAVSVHKVRSRVEEIVGQRVSLQGLAPQQEAALVRLTEMRTFVGDAFVETLESTRKGRGRKRGPGRRSRQQRR